MRRRAALRNKATPRGRDCPWLQTMADQLWRTRDRSSLWLTGESCGPRQRLTP